MNSKKRFLVAALILVISLSGCGKIKTTFKDFVGKFKKDTLPARELRIKTEGEELALKVEIADDLEERKKGYMFREKIKEGEGMWFAFEEPGIQKFWMRNVKFPLDIIFAGENMEVRAIAKNAQPCAKDPCEIFTSPNNTKFVLEVPAGYSEAHKVAVGDDILLP